MSDGGCSLKNPSRRRLRIKPQQDAETHIKLKTDKAGLREVFVNSYKGRGVFASIPFTKGDFLLEYKGKLFTPDRPPVIETYSETEATFLFDFQWKGNSWCIDASMEDQSLGRLVNDEHKNPNCKMRPIEVDSMPHLCLFAIRDIVPEEEITYNYGDSDWPWRKQISTSPVTTPSVDEDLNDSRQSLNSGDAVEPLSSNVNEISTSPVTTPSVDEDLNDSGQSLNSGDAVEPLSSNVNEISTSPVTTPSVDEDLNDSRQSLNSGDAVEPLSSNVNKISTSPVTTPSVDEDLNDSRQSLNSGDAVEPLSSNVNKAFQSRITKLKQHHDKCTERYMASKEERNAIEGQHTFLLHQRMLLDQQPAELTNHMNEASDESTDESSHTDYSDVDYIPDTEGSDCEDLSLTPIQPPQKARFPKLIPVTGYGPDKESSTEKDHTVKKRLAFSPGKKKKWTVRTQKKNSTPLCPEKESGLTVIPEKDSSLIISSETEECSVEVLCTTNTQERRVYDKRNYCLYCSKPTSKISRHLQTVHHNKPEVAKALYYPKDSKERRVRLAILRNRGNFTHNTDVVRKGTGHLVARYRTKEIRQGKDFIHCLHCQGLYSKKTLWKHIKICQEQAGDDAPQVGRKRVRSLCALSTPVGLDIGEGLKKILTHMIYDEVFHVVQNDKCILQLGQYMFNKLKNRGNNNDDYIRQKMREVGRMVLEAKKITPLKKMKDFFIPQNFPYVISAVKAAAGYEPKTNTYQTPSLALKLGHSLKKISSIVESNALMVGDHVTAEYAKRYRTIHDGRWEEFISSGALNTLKEAKWNMPQVLPFTQDVKLLNHHMEKQQCISERMLKISPTPENYAALTKVTLALAITFNRRRAGEVSRMLLSAFRSRNKSVLHDDVAICLTSFERKMCEFFTRVEIRGKRGRMVPVLLKPAMVTAMELLAEVRESCGVPSDNLFVFARPDALSAYRGGECLQKYAKLCGAKHPEALTSTKLRKHIATMSQVLNLEENESDQLADFLGHDIRIHRQYYRLPQGTLQLARMSKVLLAMERGTVSQFKGMTLDDIEIDPEEKMPDSNEEEASSDPSDEEDEFTSTDMDTSTSSEPPPAATPPTQEPAERRRQRWEGEEIKAVEKHLMNFIRTFTVPGKRDAVVCLQNETALKHRTWTDVKNYVRNRITALKRQTSTSK
ncbi:uncharacterized protein LOC131444863 isoform X2 [Solea solea]|uniref:uncharacterized protein LOC131444863 isoform X2 n=1 Tax=Solea solea TaxID=90069 RepID=UPI00272CECDC|nr:uncharacterized protein LOC131444863 isoform X2 [Solea solea]